ncbi:MAG: YceD family protein [Acidimicrobiales bacterium]
MASHPFRVTVVELLRQPGTRRHLSVHGPLSGLALSSAWVPDDADVTADLVLESQHESLTATGTVRAAWLGECRRCLRPVAGVADAHVQEVFERHPTEGETYALGGDQVDLEPMIRDAALLALPLTPLCAEVCAGPAPAVHPVRVEADDGDGRASPDPRWAALDRLRFD